MPFLCNQTVIVVVVVCCDKTGNQDGFSTLRSHRMVSKQAEEWQLQSELREQMQGYKRMRHQHKHQVHYTELMLYMHDVL